MVQRHYDNPFFSEFGLFHSHFSLFRLKTYTISDFLKEFENIYFIFTFSNSDTEGNYYNKKILDFKKGKKNIFIVPSFGSKYSSMLKHCDCIIGNSSSGIIESATFNLPTINLGDRQKNRYAPKNVHHCPFNSKKINKLFYKLLSYKKIKLELSNYDKNLIKKKEIIFFNKSDLFEDNEINEKLKEFKKKIKTKYEIISVYSNKDIQKIKKILIQNAN